jgi:glucosamine-6-phosphate deaminase
MDIKIYKSKEELGQAAARDGARLIRETLLKKDKANIIVATGASQFEMLASLVKEDIDWAKVTAFHLDEYIDLPLSHPASFRKYLKERFVSKVSLKTFFYIDGERDTDAECSRLNEAIKQHPIDVAFVGIGENGHLAFNDPPADFNIESPYIVVNLDEDCRNQQYGEGWFGSLEEVPGKAISMSVKQILKSTHIICSVPDERKSMAVKNTIEGVVSPDVPASIMQTHSNTTLYLDYGSASKLMQFKK